MRNVFLDTETTSLTPGQIAQLSYIVEDNGKVQGKNFFFKVDSMDEGAEKVTGHGVDYYRMASGGRVFADSADEIAADLNGSVLIAHNIKFDMGFLSREAFRCGRRIIPVNTVCTMEHYKDILKIPGKRGYKFPKLAEVVNHYGIDERKVMKYSKKLFNCNDDAMFHDSRFDTAAMYVAVVFERCSEVMSTAAINWVNYFAKG